MNYRITPETRQMVIKLTLNESMSHHDPDEKTGSNMKSFNRKTKLFRLPETNAQPLSIDDINALAAQFPVPKSAEPLFIDATPYQFFAAALLCEFIDRYGAGEGAGLFSGAGRYDMLFKRVSALATRALTLDRWWSMLIQEMNVGAASGRSDNSQKRLALLLGKRALYLPVLNELRENLNYVLLLARLWRDAYFTDLKSGELGTTVAFNDTHFEAKTHVAIDIPEVSANGIRHEMIREPSMIHLLSRLNIALPDLHPATAAMLYNGGAMAGAAPSNVFSLQRQIRQGYPSLGLLGACTDTFMLGAGALEVNSWIVAREYEDELVTIGLHSETSIFEMLDSVVHVRHNGGGTVETSPMPFSYEVLIAGTEIAVVLRLRPYANVLEQGALICALKTYFDSDNTIGGQSAKGHGLNTATVLREIEGTEEAAAAYEQYLSDNADQLRKGLLDGTLCTEVSVLGGRAEPAPKAAKSAKPAPSPKPPGKLSDSLWDTLVNE